MQRTVVVNVVGLTPNVLKRAPRLSQWAAAAGLSRIDAAFPAVTCTAQSDYLTGRYPETHGIVGNGWYFRDECEIRFWRQSNKLVEAPKVWDVARAADPAFTCANVFWWYNMYSTADVPSRRGRCTSPTAGSCPTSTRRRQGLRDELQQALGQFPLFDFWGPRASIASTPMDRGIGEAGRNEVSRRR